MMKRIFFIGIIISISIASCSKDVDLTEVNPTLPPSTPVPLGPDTILYTNPADIYLVSPIGSYFPCSPIPIPLDTLFSDSIDLDLDGTFDLKFSDKHYIQGFSASNPCPTYRCHLSVVGMNSNIKIATTPPSYYGGIVGFYINDSISSTNDYFQYAFLKGAPMIGPAYIVTSPGEYYIGIQLIQSSKTIYGWVRLENTGMNGVIIKDYAVNITNGNPILAGQML